MNTALFIATWQAEMISGDKQMKRSKICTALHQQEELYSLITYTRPRKYIKIADKELIYFKIK